MNYCCPNCETDLQRRYMKLAARGEPVTKLPFASRIFKKRVALCPSCHTALAINAHPFDQAMTRLGALPLAIMLAGEFLNSLAIQGIAGVVLVVGIVWAVRETTKPSYRSWRYWRLHADRM